MSLTAPVTPAKKKSSSRTMTSIAQTPKKAFSDDPQALGRVVLLIDFFHPDLTDKEITVIKQLLPAQHPTTQLAEEVSSLTLERVPTDSI